jgi:hypothetical protein
MTEPNLVRLLLLLVACTGLACAWLAHSAARTRRDRDRVLLRLERCEGERDALTWHVWHVRNAAESAPSDPAKADALRLAIAGMLAPDRETFTRDLHRLATDDELPESVRQSAFLARSELLLPEAPWLVGDRHGLPRWSAYGVSCAYRESLAGWHELAPGLRFTPHAVEAPKLPPR